MKKLLKNKSLFIQLLVVAAITTLFVSKINLMLELLQSWSLIVLILFLLAVIFKVTLKRRVEEKEDDNAMTLKEKMDLENVLKQEMDEWRSLSTNTQVGSKTFTDKLGKETFITITLVKGHETIT